MSETDRNRQTAITMYDRALAGDLAGAGEFFAPDYRLTQSPAHPFPGSWTGADADAARGQVFTALGLTGMAVSEVIADGPHRVIGLLEAFGVDGDGGEWRMPVTECLWIEDGKVTDIKPYYWDYALMHRVAASRGAAA
jgi:ketosteroid isomerase-like protein